MLIYQDHYQNYKERDTPSVYTSSRKHVEKKTSKTTLKRKNIKLLTSLGLTVKNDK